MTNQCRSGSSAAASAWPVSTLEHTYPGHVDQGQQVRSALRCLYSNSKRPGGQFAMTVHDFTGDYVYAEVRDQGSSWDADLGRAAGCPHGLYLLQQMATAYGAAGGRRGWMIWFTVSYPAAAPAPAERKAPW
jgi:hypothetical protein